MNTNFYFFKDGTQDDFEPDVMMASVVHSMADLDSSNIIHTLGMQDDIVKTKYYVGDPTDAVNMESSPSYTWSFTKKSQNEINGGTGTSLYSLIKGNRSMTKTLTTYSNGLNTKMETNKDNIATIDTEITGLKNQDTTHTNDINTIKGNVLLNTNWRTTNSSKLGDLSSYPISGATFVQDFTTTKTKTTQNETDITTLKDNISASFPYKKSANSNRTEEDIVLNRQNLANLSQKVYAINAAGSDEYYDNIVSAFPSIWHSLTPIHSAIGVEHDLNSLTVDEL